MSDRSVVERQLQAEVERLTLECEKFDTALSFSDDFNYIFDTAGKFTYASRPLLALWQLPIEQVVGKTFFELPYDAELARRLHEEISIVVRLAAQFRGQTYYRGPSGREGWYEYIFNPVCDAAGNVRYVAGSTRDVTSRIEQEQTLAALMDSERAARSEAERAGRAKDEFLATLSHELRTPLNSIMGWAELLRGGLLSADKAREGVERILHNCDAQAQLISDLLDMNALVAGRVRLRTVRVPLSEPLHAALDRLRPDAEAKGVALVAPEFDTRLELRCDPDRLQQAFWNLLANAIKFTPAHGTVTVSVNRLADQRVRIDICDSGRGFEPAFVPHLFTRFSQEDGSSTRGYGGLGLGLSLCKTLVEMQGGEIAAHSDGLDRGATFRITLALGEQAASVAPGPSGWNDSAPGPMPTPEEAAALSGLRVLVVDDDDEGRSFAVRLLVEYGAVVTERNSAAGALQALGASAFDLMISDIGMPEKDGYTLMREIRASAQREINALPAVALTAFAREEDALSARRAGFDRYLSKPAAAVALLKACLGALSGGTEARPP